MLTLSGEKRLQTAAPRVLVHPYTCVADLHLHVREGFPIASARFGGHSPCAQGEGATFGHCIHRVEDEIEEGLTQFALHPHDGGQVRREVHVHVDD